MITNKMMTQIATSFLLAILVFGSGAAQTTNAAQLQAGHTVAICGDSIAEQKQYSLFMDNPFAKTFASVEKTVWEQQAFETPGVKNILHSLPDGIACCRRKK
jgi:hypothetical protein